MNKIFNLACICILITSCTATRPVQKDDGKIEVHFVQVNDVYEIAPLTGGIEGGVARIASLKKKYLAHNANTFLVIAGDFLSPSVFNSLQHEGKPIRGRQMIESLNAAGTDFACFGNHEFDIRENELQQRIDEASFQWIATNTFHKVKDSIKPFTSKGIPVPKTYIINVKDGDGTRAKIGLIGLCLPFNKASYVVYTDAIQSAKNAFDVLKDSVDAVIAITHQNMWEDEMLAKEIPGLAAILGGHEHDQRFKKIGRITITKAMANAKTAYITTLKINTRKNKYRVEPTLEVLDEKIALDSATQSVVQKWQDIAEASYASLGFNAGRIVLERSEPLEGRESHIRTQQTNLGNLITRAIMFASPKADLAIMNSGSIRVDDILNAPLTEYDIIRTLPFGGSIKEADIKGSLLIQVLNQGMKNIGSGGYLLYNSEVQYQDGKWKLNNLAIADKKIYRVAITEFLLTGKEANLDYLNPNNPGIIKVYETSGLQADVRKAVIGYLDSMF